MRSVRRLDGHRATPLILKSLRFFKEEDIDACNFPRESDFTLELSDSESEYGADSTISRESTPLPVSISEFEDDEIHTTSQNDASELDDEYFRCKPQQWNDHSDSEDVPSCTTPQQPSSDVDDEVLSPEPREPSSIFECGEELAKEGQQDEGPLEEKTSPRTKQFSPVYQSYPEFDYGEKDDDSVEADSPEPRRLFPVHRSHSALNDPPQQLASQVETFCPGPMRRFLTPKSMAKLDFFEDWFVHMSERRFINESPGNPISEISSPEDQFRLTSYDHHQPASQMEIFCPKPIRQYPTHKVIQRPELFEDWHVDMSEPVFFDEALSPERQSSSSETPSPEQQKFLPPVRRDSPYPEFDHDVESLPEADSPELRRPFSAPQFHSTLMYDPKSVLGCDDDDEEEAFETVEYIPVESLNL